MLFNYFRFFGVFIFTFFLLSCIHYQVEPEINSNIYDTEYIDSNSDGINNILKLYIESKNEGICKIYSYKLKVSVYFENYRQGASNTYYTKIDIEETQYHVIEIDIGAHDVLDMDTSTYAIDWDIK